MAPSVRKSKKAAVESAPAAVQVSSGRECPKCGGSLIQRKGKYGSFIGCKTFPSCRYTVKMSVSAKEKMDET
ncbi:topoisomerase DNA-binding C4 zinc finger domain-containing protein [Sporosarcina obsidiansis]|uniref:topoisomerase DNA-binding C4 zinc finger domain-containing protein n=1 Tax=Sporosarcina obsidiansis TaxID=2660748 RepID=UPI0038B59E15